MKHLTLKKTVSFLLIAVLTVIFLPIEVKSTTFDKPLISGEEKTVTDSDIVYGFEISSPLAVSYETTRRQTYEKTAALYSDDLIALSDAAWVLYPAVYRISAAIDGENRYECLCFPVTDSAIQFSLLKDILPSVAACGLYDSTFIEGGKVMLYADIALDMGDKRVALSESVCLSETEFPPLMYIDYGLPATAYNHEENPVFAFYPTKEDITLQEAYREGYRFTAWKNESGISVGKIPAGTTYLKLTPQWEAKVFKIRYVLTTRSGSFIHVSNAENPTQITYGESVTLHDLTPPDGWCFCGWYTSADFSGESLKELTLSQAGDTVLYAKWLTEDEKIRQDIADAHWGDLDSDGSITAADSRLALRHCVGLETLSKSLIKRADFFSQGTLNTDAARIILRITVGLDDIKDILTQAGVITTEDS